HRHDEVRAEGLKWPSARNAGRTGGRKSGGIVSANDLKRPPQASETGFFSSLLSGATGVTRTRADLRATRGHSSPSEKPIASARGALAGRPGALCRLGARALRGPREGRARPDPWGGSGWWWGGQVDAGTAEILVYWTEFSRFARSRRTRGRFASSTGRCPAPKVAAAERMLTSARSRNVDR